MDSSPIENSCKKPQSEPSCMIVKHSGFYTWQEDQWQLITKEDLQFQKKIINDGNLANILISVNKLEAASYILEPEPLCKLFPHAGSDRGFTWRASTEGPDKSRSLARFAIRFESPRQAVSFQSEYTRIHLNN